MRVIWIYLKHFIVVTLLLGVIGFGVLVKEHGSIQFSLDELAYMVDKEGPHVFVKGDSLSAYYINGSRETGYSKSVIHFDNEKALDLPVYFPLDGSTFTVNVKSEHTTPPSVYDDNEAIIAISDLEGNYQTLRNFLIAHKVIDPSLNWMFGKGHLVFVGDLVDRGFSTTQLLWFIYRLESEAKKKGGMVHVIIGNHEIKNLQGNFTSAAPKYYPIAGILGKQQYELFGPQSVIGLWLQSKNVIERINGYLFLHGGLHPDVGKYNLSLTDVNDIVRSHYRKMYYTGLANTDSVELLISDRTGPAWYRGYFKESLDQDEVDVGIKAFDAKAAVVGHTIQFKVNQIYNDKVIAIDVKHAEDYSSGFPSKHSEGLLIKDGNRFRLLENGERVLM